MMVQNEKRRTDWDYFRGIGILLVVIGHSATFPAVSNVIYLFHLALFYFASGFFFSQSITFLSFLKKKLKSLYFPWLKYGLFFLLAHNLFIYFHFYSYNNVFQIRDYFVHFIKIVCFIGTDDLLGPLWFLRSLFICNLLFFFIQKVGKKTSIISLTIVFLIGISYFLYHSCNHTILLIVRELLSCSFVCLGYLYRRYETCFLLKFKWVYILVSFLFLIILSFIGHVNLVNTDITSPVFFFVSGACGIYLVLGISKHLDNWGHSLSLLKTIGRNAIHILSLHWISFKVVSFIIIVSYQLSYLNLAKVTIIGGYWWILYSVVGIILPIFIIKSLVFLKNILKTKKIKS